ncbi:MAG: 30S ribosomal protein S17 [Cenarchaeum sp. SB0665_bin_23]|nr:30S ribosomal protein S17 [Cenarchaeum sp. SB0667_bin_13]MXY61205.1 30S ribosomal protein S17 [Cenarchaeum sp. SB0665_bin_23]MXZ93916.1 30S ribosomal protein S17 [Cenarchaeum sp. SB0666_bin_15]MYB46871.1 30S ribosomal protein S17 [Cenarchaeum sp. SB0662_bin_33]MYC80013.1 30S ribosomal protein S17 [Cenarchaeum sp. SB0661_bin_35]MYD59385.1 30S ribosomal protein S17 [Cenarchaeum sp. SB0678_bin_8]MYG33598.1 30S ribosomal protein S17 [Cenarchaeum sp. SB0677_bin_16]MYI51438.1 30S ribosomal prot
MEMIGIDTTPPTDTCTDTNCPYHGGLPIRGKLLEGRVSSIKAKKTITLQRESPVYIKKFKRYARSKSTIHAHVPECMDVEDGDIVLTAECRPLSKSISFVVVEVRA